MNMVKFNGWLFLVKQCYLCKIYFKMTRYVVIIDIIFLQFSTSVC